MNFRYECLDSRGRQTSGKLQATGREDAIAQLLQKGIRPVHLEEIRPTIWTKEIHFGASSVRNKDFVLFCREFAALVEAGIPLVVCLRTLIDQTSSKALRSVLSDVLTMVAEGNALSDSFAKYPKVFPEMFVHMVHAGEVSGTLGSILNRTASYTERQHETSEKIKSALIYPISVSVFAVFICIFLLVRVIPIFERLFKAQHMILPLPTRVILSASGFVVDKWYVVAGITALCVVLFIVLQVNTRARLWRDKHMLTIPIFGTLIQKSNVARTARTMALLFRSTVPVLQTMSITADVVTNRYIAATIRSARDSVEDGSSMYQRFAESKAFPPMLAQMLRVGEETGTLDEMLNKIADFYESDVAAMADRLRQLMEPLMIGVLAVVVGGIVLSVLLPMFSIYQNLGHIK